jgi:fumarate reductase flavoprotein subunit
MMPPPAEESEKDGGMPPMGGPGTRTGTYLMKLMRETCQKEGVEILLNTRVTDAEVTDGKFTAIIAESPEGTIKINCRAVIMATGSWICNQKYLELANPTFATMDFGKPRPSGHTNCNYTGDSIPLAEKVGAFVDYDSFCIRPMGPGLVSKTGEPIFPRGQMADAMLRSPYALQIDEQGNRYTCEPSGTRFAAEDSAHVVIVHGSTMPFVVFDLNTAKATVAAAKNNMSLGKEGGMGGPSRITISLEEIEEDLAKESFMFKADTVEELAEKLGIPAANLKDTVDLYNDSCQKGFDQDCFKEEQYLVPLTGPYYGFMTALNTDGAFGGVRVNADIQAYAKDGGLVEGLWVPGDFSSGRFVNDRGLKRQVINDLAWAFSSGFQAGENAVKYLTKA